MESQFHEISNRKIMGKPPNMWKRNGAVLNNPWVKEKVSREIQLHFELKENNKAL